MDTPTCRVCLKKSKDLKISIFENTDDNKQFIVDKIMQCADIKITYEKNLPDKICEKCLKNLNIAYNFRGLCKNSDNTLKFLMNKNNRNNVIVSLNNGKTYKLPEDVKLKIIKVGKTNENDKNKTINHHDKNISSKRTATANNENIQKNISGIVKGFDWKINRNNKKKQKISKKISTQIFLPAAQKKYAELKESTLSTFYTLVNEDNDCENVTTENVENNSDIDFEADVVENVEYNSHIDFEADVVENVENNSDDDFEEDVIESDFEEDVVENVETQKKYIGLLNDGGDCITDGEDKNLSTSVKIVRLKVHIEDQNKTFICEICGNIYKKNCQLRMHVKRHHDERNYPCEICGRLFLTNSLLARHIKRHTGHKPFKCSFCTRKFYEKGTCKAHEKTHSGIRPFECNVCDKTFVYSQGLTKHMLIHKEIKLYNCVICDKEFRLKHHLTQHEQTLLHQQAVEKHTKAVK